MMNTKRLTIYSDGAATPNPGPAGIGAVIYDGEGKVVSELSKPIGRATNNRAEFLALIAGLEEALRLGAGHVDINLDSELIARQLDGKYRSKALKPLYERTLRLLQKFESYSVKHIPRERNRAADALSKRAITKPRSQDMNADATCKVEVPSVSEGDAHNIALMIEAGIYPILLQPLLDRLGTEGTLEALRPAIDRMGQTAPAFARMMGIEGNDALAIASVIRLIEERVLKCEGRVTEASPDRVAAELTKCPFQGLTPDFCRIYDSITGGMVKAMNPEYELKTTKMLTKGDPVCRWVLERKQP